jgi:hypothetical protein
MDDSRNALNQEMDYNGLLIGTIFSFGSLLLSLTFFVPIISVFPGVILESLASALVDNNPYSNVGKTTIVLTTILFLVVLFLALFNIRRITLKGVKVSKTRITLIMVLMYLIIHPLGFYIYWGQVLNYRSDGQLIFSAVESFPKSSWAFIVIGLIIDGVKNFGHPRI